jgi:hypothetical protein
MCFGLENGYEFIFHRNSQGTFSFCEITMETINRCLKKKILLAWGLAYWSGVVNIDPLKDVALLEDGMIQVVPMHVAATSIMTGCDLQRERSEGRFAIILHNKIVIGIPM